MLLYKLEDSSVLTFITGAATVSLGRRFPYLVFKLKWRI